MVLIWDRSKTNPGPQIKAFLDAAKSVSFHSPPYAPELNPVEYVWSYLKTKPLANLACPDVGRLAVLGRRHRKRLFAVGVGAERVAARRPFTMSLSPFLLCLLAAVRISGPLRATEIELPVSPCEQGKRSSFR